MAVQQERGLAGENLAVNHLVKNGYEILERNCRIGKSEIDIIVKKENTLVFVEVKTRSSSKFGNPEDFVDEKKTAMIISGAENYILNKQWTGPIRFDIISVLHTNKPEITHFKDAFY